MSTARGLLLAALCSFGLALAQSPFPSKPVRLIVTSPPGGSNDILNRIVGAKLGELLAQPVLIDNRPGASGFVAAEMVAKSAPDGYTLLAATEATLVANPLFFRNVPYDPQRDFAPVTIAVEIGYVLLVHPSVPAKSVEELIALARTAPGRLNYASSGNGSAFHIGMELFKRMAGVDIVHVPFKGSALSVNAMLAGEVQIMLNGTPNGVPLAKSGKLRALAVAGARRSPLAPELPTIAESGLPGYEMSGWFGTVAPAGTPAAVVAVLNREYVRALHVPEVRERLEGYGFEVVGNTPEEFASRMRSESQRLARVIRESGAKPE
ncbi:MAG TPA: tripartite tricarboxylate transporter substrate binding protein [Burkholderiales bacterium]|jgi:tripartite-type tricarboxylate transporter receptor subunit TctC|nr:tripartite tricarboxylate transporter substrate binding protein [Burkholderiales bacterium]